MSFAPTLDGALLRSARLEVPWSGVWVAYITLDVPDAALSGRHKLELDTSTWSGTIAPLGGSWGNDAAYRLVGGAGAWGHPVGRRGYHNDAGVQRSTVAQDAAAEVGETISVDSSVDGAMGPDYAREVGPASRVLEQLWPVTTWWVDADGTTQVGARDVVDVSNDVELVSYDPSSQMAIVRAEDASKLVPGSSISDDRAPDGAIVIRDASITLAGRGLVCEAWCGQERARGRVVDAIRRIARDPRQTYFGTYRYRVVQMKGDRVSVQRVSEVAPELGDLEPVGQVPGVAGASSQLTPGGVAYLTFADGDPSRPILVGYTRVDDSGHKPQTTAIDVTSQLKLGESATLVLLAGGSYFAARADITDQRLSALETAHNNHAHGGVATGSGSTTTPNIGTVAAGSSTAASKVKIS